MHVAFEGYKKESHSLEFTAKFKTSPDYETLNATQQEDCATKIRRHIIETMYCTVVPRMREILR